MLQRLYKIATSLRLTVILLALGLVLVFWGTLAQVHSGLYKAQNEFFRSFFIYWQPTGSSLRIPIFPGGYLVGGLFLINLFAAHLRYYQPGKRKWGIVMIHLGVVLLVLGQFLTDFLATESSMHIREGSSANYSEAFRSYELAVVDTTDPKFDKVVAIPAQRLRHPGDISNPALPFTIRVRRYYDNSAVTQKAGPGYEPIPVTAGVGAGVFWRELPHETEMERRDMPSGLVELVTPQGVLGTFLISSYLARPQEFSYQGRQYELALRPERYYKPFRLHLVEFRFDRYAGTEIPKNFSSRVRVERPDTGENREVLIYMNNPLRYGGETFYQADWDKADEKGTILQVVRNPSWLTPYFACALVAVGMIYQFLSHLIGFALKRKAV